MTDVESLVRRKRFRRTLSSLAVALSLAVFPSGTKAQQAPTRMVVEGRPVPLTNGVPSLRKGRLFLPLFSITEALGDTVESDSAGQRIRVRLSHTGETSTFLRATGEVRREGSVLGVLPDAAEVVIALRPENQQLPLDVLSLLLEVSIEVIPEQGMIAIRRETQIQLAPQVRQRLPVGLSRVDYSETLGFVGDNYGHTVRFGTEGQLYDGILTGGVDLTGGTNRRAFNFQRGFVSLERPSGQRWTGGDFTLGRDFRLAAAPVRGFSLDQPIGDHRLSLFGGGALSGATVGAGQFSLRQFNTGVAGLLWSNVNLRAGRTGLGYGLGGLHFAGATRRGSLFLQQLSHQSRRNQFHLDAGVGQFRVTSQNARRTGADFGLDVTDSFLLRRHTFVFRGSHFGTRFVTPQVNDSRRGRDLLSGAWSAPFLNAVTVGTSYTHTRVRLGTPQSTNTYTWSAAYNNPRRFLPEVSVFHTIVGGTGPNELNNFHLNLSRTLRRLRPFLSYNRLGLPRSTVQSATFGASADLPRHGSLQAYQNVSSGGLLSGAVDWTPARLWGGLLHVSGGIGSLPNPSGPPGVTATRLTARATVGARLPSEHSLQFSFQNNGFRNEFRITVGGAIFARRSELRMASQTQRQAVARPSRVLGRLYVDRNRNGRFEPETDFPLSRIRLWLDHALLAVTDENGAYRYPTVLAGPHELRVDFATVRADLAPLNELERTLEIPAGVEFTLDFSFVRTGMVQGVAWFDANGNGVFDAGENPASDLRILCSCGQDALTTADGSFILGDVLPGEIYLSLDLQGLPAQFEVEPKRIQVVVSGSKIEGLRFALQPAAQRIEERELPPQPLFPRPQLP